MTRRGLCGIAEPHVSHLFGPLGSLCVGLNAESLVPESHGVLRESPQGELLRHAIKLVEGERQSVYGPPHEDFAKTVGQLNALGYRGPGGRLLVPRDWAVMMVACKQSRLNNTPDHYDSVVDGGGYFGTYWECVTHEKVQEE